MLNSRFTQILYVILRSNDLMHSAYVDTDSTYTIPV